MDTQQAGKEQVKIGKDYGGSTPLDRVPPTPPTCPILTSPNLPHLPQPPAHHVGLNAFLLNSYKTEYKILASTIVIKENFNSAVSGHLVHTVKCFFLCGFFFLFLFLFFLSFFFFLIFSFLFPSQPLSRGCCCTNQQCVNVTLVEPALAVFINCKVEKVSPGLIKKELASQ